MWLLLADWKHPSSARRTREEKGEINVVHTADEGQRVIT